MKDKKPSKPDEEKRSYFKYYALAFELVAMNVALIVGGNALDGLLSTTPVAILLGTLLSIAGTIWLLTKSL